jgi:hypothetical protein
MFKQRNIRTAKWVTDYLSRKARNSAVYVYTAGLFFREEWQLIDGVGRYQEKEKGPGVA